MKLNEQLLRKFIREIIVERKGDREFRADAEKVRRQLMAALPTAPASKWVNFTQPTLAENEVPGLAIKLKDCGIEMPAPLEDMSVGYVVDEEATDMGGDAAATFRPAAALPGSGKNVLPDFPGGIIIFRVTTEGLPSGDVTMGMQIDNNIPASADENMFPPSRGEAQAARRLRADTEFVSRNAEEFMKKFTSKKNAGKYLSKIIDLMKDFFIHEMRHMYSFIPRAGKTGEGEQMEKFLDTWEVGDHESYYKSNHEANAYLIQGFENMVRDFERFYSLYAIHQKNPHMSKQEINDISKPKNVKVFEKLYSELSSVEKQPNKRGAKVYAPNATATWDKFYANLGQGFRYNLRNETDRIMKKFAARVLDMWDEYYESLPN